MPSPVLSIGLSVWLVPLYGALGAAIASSVSLVLTLPVNVIFISKNIGAIWPMRDAIRITLATLIMGLIVYALQAYLGVVMSLILGIPLGVVIYIIAILALKVVHEQDIAMLKKIQGSFPILLRKHYIHLVELLERIVVKKKLNI